MLKNIKILYYLLCINLPCTFVCAQQVAIEWQTLVGEATRDEQLNDIIALPNSGYLAVGEKSGIQNATDYDFLLIKTNATGTPLWQRTYGGSQIDKAFAATLSNDGNAIVVGVSNSLDQDVHQPKGSDDMWVVKIDLETGDTLWTRNFGGTLADQAYNIVSLNNGEYVIVGDSESSNGDFNLNRGFTDACLLKIDNNGNLIWQKTYGGSFFDRCRGIAYRSEDNELVAVGSSSSSNYDLTTNNGGADYWIFKVNADNGNLNWQRSMGGSLGDNAQKVAFLPDGAVALIGDSLSDDLDVGQNSGYDDFWIICLNPDGTTRWSRVLGDASYDQAHDLIATPDGAVVAVGASLDASIVLPNYAYDLKIVKLAQTNGQMIWDELFGGSNYEFGKSIVCTQTGKYAVACTTDSSSGDGDVDTSNRVTVQYDEQMHGNHNAWIVGIKELDTGIENTSQTKIDLCAFPNPTSKQWQCTLRPDSAMHGREVLLRVIDAAGKIVEVQTKIADELVLLFSFDAQDWDLGIYRVEAHCQNKYIGTTQMVLIR